MGLYADVSLSLRFIAFYVVLNYNCSFIVLFIITNISHIIITDVGMLELGNVSYL